MQFENVSGFMLAVIATAPALIYLCAHIVPIFFPKEKKGDSPVNPDDVRATASKVEREEREKKSRERLEYNVG